MYVQYTTTCRLLTSQLPAYNLFKMQTDLLKFSTNDKMQIYCRSTMCYVLFSGTSINVFSVACLKVTICIHYIMCSESDLPQKSQMT